MEQRNLLIAIVLSVGILIAFQFALEHMRPPQPAAPPAGTTATAPAKTGPGAQSAPPSAASASAPGAAAPAHTVETRQAALAEQPRVEIATPRLHGSIDLLGARLDDLTLADYHETVDPKSPEVGLLSPPGTQDPYLAEFGWVATTPDIKVPGPQTRWTASSGPLTPTSPVTLTWDNGQGLIFTRVISVDANYMFTVRDAVRNTGDTPVKLLPYGLISRTGTPHVAGYYILHEGLIGYLGGSLHEVKYSSLTPGTPLDYASEGGWLGFTDKYWLTSLIPPQNEAVKARFTHTVDAGTDRYQADYLGKEVTVPPGGTAESSARFFAGAKEVNLLDAYKDSGIPLFDRAIDFGWFYFLTKPIFLILQFFYQILGNFGLAILLLTLCVKLLFFPLANKSYQAMSKMKLLQPEIQKLRERFPDDKARQQQEMMALYKRVGANPLAGCLPIVIQIPVFFALYKVLFVTIEMRHAPFFGWIHDLSAPDPTSFANLFGLLPFVPPAILMIGAWPLIMGLTMFLQQKLNPQPVDPVQARMFMLLPIVFTYMLAAFPAGLVIYWAWNNLLSIGQQWAIMHRAGAA
ncbi:MAG: membrane protein insertase YidC [Alphaproteobacteria bacterium]|nr:membrane protein insertase YidC [Alphaproteobacteria bacterium]MBV9374164.1 membrane protein insertase YidC [Alphaproteobacteria bacterium]MBV9814294.1 membrane protein insertase YidC [Alphaproteobacteria bacterium]